MPLHLIRFEVRSGPSREPGHEAQSFQRRADHWPTERARERRPVAELRRKYCISDASIYKRKAKYGGIEVSEVKRLKALNDASPKLRPDAGRAMLDNVALKDLLKKKW